MRSEGGWCLYTDISAAGAPGEGAWGASGRQRSDGTVEGRRGKDGPGGRSPPGGGRLNRSKGAARLLPLHVGAPYPGMLAEPPCDESALESERLKAEGILDCHPPFRPNWQEADGGVDLRHVGKG
jgi:hypothetical protein